MARTTFLLLLIVSPPWTYLVTSLKEKDNQKRLSPRKALWNPYHPNDGKILELLDFSAEDSDYFTNTFGNLSDVETKIKDRHLKINGRHYKLIKPDEKPYKTVDHLDIDAK